MAITPRLPATLLATVVLWLGASLPAWAGLRIDVIAFNHPGASGAGYWADHRPLPPCHAVRLHDGGGAEAVFSDGSSGCLRSNGYDPATGGFPAAGNSLLGGHAAKLKAKGYALLLDRGWKQIAAGQSPVTVTGGRRDGARQELSGTISVGGSDRMPEVTLQLVLTRMDGDTPQYVVLEETRRLKPDEPNYFDHPLFGVILQVSNDGNP